MKRKKILSNIGFIALLAVAFDQLLKVLVTFLIRTGNTKEIIHNFFSITVVHNYGAAWSMFWNERIYLILIGILSLSFVIFLFYKDKHPNKYKSIYYGLLTGGIIGNLIDRIFLGYVIDFLDFKFFNYDYPIFNISDIAIVVSVLLICVECFLPNDIFNDNEKIEVEVIDFDE